MDKVLSVYIVVRCVIKDLQGYLVLTHLGSDVFYRPDSLLHRIAGVFFEGLTKSVNSPVTILCPTINSGPQCDVD